MHIFRDQILCLRNGGVPKRGCSVALFAQLNMDEVVSIYILHGVMAQQNFDSFFKCNIQFFKTYKIFWSWISITAVNTLRQWHFEIYRVRTLFQKQFSRAFPGLSRLQIDFSRTPKFTVNVSLSEVTKNNVFLLTMSTHCQTYKLRQ